jgi:SNF2 family DNA or RNA helicase
MPTKKRKEILTGTDKKLYIINYDAVPIMEAEILAKKFNLVIADESTYIKSWKAKRTKSMINVGHAAPMRFAMTGTPFGQRVLDVYAQLKFACPQLFGESWFSFRNKYCEMGIINKNIKDKNGKVVKVITGNKNMPELEQRIRNVAKVYRKADCLKDLPSKIYETRTCELTGEQKTHYKEMLEYLFTIVNKDTVVNVTSVLTQMLKLAQITSGFLFSNGEDKKLILLKDNPKLKLLEETLDEVSGKVVIFCKFRHDIELISKIGHCVTFTGDTAPEARDEAIRKFNTDPDILYFISSSAGGYGLNLQVAHTVIFYSHEWSVEKRVQQEDRVHRAGQTEPVTIIDLVCDNTIDTYVTKACKEKRDVTSALVDAIKNREEI